MTAVGMVPAKAEGLVAIRNVHDVDRVEPIANTKRCSPRARSGWSSARRSSAAVWRTRAAVTKPSTSLSSRE
jgi:hypothetical protein